MTALEYGSRTDRPPYSAGTSPTCTSVVGCMSTTDLDGRCFYCARPITRTARQRLAALIALYAQGGQP